MPQPIPSYLIAIAVGDIKFKAINDTIGVYAEQYILDASAEEFAETPQMEVVNTELYGPYRWGRYDLIVLPPSFPFGGMENPRLSFMTPTLSPAINPSPMLSPMSSRIAGLAIL